MQAIINLLVTLFLTFGAILLPVGSGGPGGGMPPSSGTTTSVTIASSTSGYGQNGGSAVLSDKTFIATGMDESAVYVADGGQLTLTNATITSSGDSSSQDNSSFYGLNAAVLAGAGSIIDLTDSTITTIGTGANGAFATGEGADVTLTNVKIDATADGAHGVMATLGGVMKLVDVDITTAGASSGAIATDRGSGAITVSGGNVTTSGKNSPAIYSTGDISVEGATMNATGAEAAVIEGANSIRLVDTDLSATMEDKWGVMIYQSMSGDAEGTQGEFEMSGGSLAYDSANGPLFYVTNSTGVITLRGVETRVVSGIFLDAAAGQWGSAGENGGHAILTLDGQRVSGNLVADEVSSITVALTNGSSLDGAINAENTAAAASLTLDASSTWNVTADSYLTCFDDADGIVDGVITNVIGNGFTVYYDAGSCPNLAGATYDLSGGGVLQPID